MAKEAPAVEAKPKNRMKLLIVFLAIGLFVVIVGVVVALLLISNKGHGNSNDDDGEEVTQEEEAGGQRNPNVPPVFSELDDFIVNLLPNPPPEPAPGGAFGDAQQPAAPYYEDNHFLQVKIVLELDAKEADARIKAQMPRIRNNLTVLLSNKTAKSLSTREGKEALSDEIMNEINSIIVPPVKGKRQAGPVVSVLFNSFLIQ